MREKLGNLALMMVSLIAAVAIAEFGLRLVYENPQPQFLQLDPVLGHTSRPNISGYYTMEGSAYVEINSAGYRDDEFSLVKNEKTRIAFIGDSFTQALQIELDKTYHGLLEQAFGQSIEAYNFGTGGYSTGQALLTYRESVRKYNPDIVVLAFYPGNDLQDNSRELSGGYARPYFELENGELIIDNGFRDSAKFRRNPLIYSGYYFLTDNFISLSLLEKLRYSVGLNENTNASSFDRDELVYGPESELSLKVWELTERLIVQLAREVDADGARFVLFVLDSIPEQAETNRDPLYVESRLGDLCDSMELSCAFMGPAAMQALASDGTKIHGFDGSNTGHWNETGHELAYRVLSDHLFQTGLLAAK